MRSCLRLTLPALVGATLVGCVGTPSVSGVSGASPAPEKPWTPPPSVSKEITAADTSTLTAVPPDLAERIHRLTLSEIVDLGLRNNSQTRFAWANAQAAAAAYGSARGEWLPTLDGDVTAQRVKTVASAGRVSVKQSVLSPSATLSYLLFDFGGRSGRVAGARRAHVRGGLQPQRGDSGRGAPDSGRILPVHRQPRASRSAAHHRSRRRKPICRRRRNGDALAWPRSRTCCRPAPRRARRSSTCIPPRGPCRLLAARWPSRSDFPANLPYDVDSSAAAGPVAPLADSVDALVVSALEGRPDLAAARSQAAAARAGIGELRSDLLPSLLLTATGGRTYATTIPNGANSYNLSLGLSIPIFNGFSRQYDLRGARFQAEAAQASAETLRQQVIFQVFSSYYGLQSATRRVRTADVLITQRRAVRYCGTRALQGGRRQRPRSPLRTERARLGAGPAGGRSAGVERVVRTTGARRRRPRSKGRKSAPSRSRHDVHS